LTGCSYCGAEPTQPFSRAFDFPVCRACGVAQHDALERIAQEARPVTFKHGEDAEQKPDEIGPPPVPVGGSRQTRLG
jgi:hypothetical protein